MYNFDYRENELRNASSFCAMQTLHVWLCRSFKYNYDVYVLAQVNYIFCSMLNVSWNMFDDYFTQPWSRAAVQVGEKTSTVCVFICLDLYLNKSTKLMCIHTHMHARAHACTRTHTHIHKHTHAHAHTCIVYENWPETRELWNRWIRLSCYYNI